MRYALLIREDESAAASPQERSRRLTGLAAFRRGLEERGALIGAEQLDPAETAATVQCWDGGDIVIASGPFAGTREQITGFAVVDCKDLDEAIEVAAKIPGARNGSIEVRPIWEM